MAANDRSASQRSAVKLTYDRGLVNEYWVVDPEIEVVRVYQREGAGFGRPLELRCDTADTLATTLLPELVIPLIDIFSD